MSKDLANPKIIEEFVITQSVLIGKQQGVVYDFGHGQLVMHKAGFGILKNFDVSKINEVLNFFDNTEIPKYFHLYNPPENLIEAIKTQKLKYNYKTRKRIVLKSITKNLLEYNLPNGYAAVPITKKNFKLTAELPLDLANKFWNGEKDFLENSFGIIILDKLKRVISICYGAAIFNGTVEIDIYTVEKYRGMGFAKAVASAFINMCKKRKLIANWDCFEDNLPSINTAISLNFYTVANYNFLSIYKLNERKNS